MTPPLGAGLPPPRAGRAGEGSFPERGAVPAAILGRLRAEAGPAAARGSLHGKMQRAGAAEAAGAQAAAGPGRSGGGGGGGGGGAAAPPGRLLRRELRLLESIFHRGHERFRIGSACPDEISCEFLPGPGARAGGSGARGPPPGPVRIHCNITVRAGPRGGRGDGGGVPRLPLSHGPLQGLATLRSGGRRFGAARGSRAKGCPPWSALQVRLPAAVRAGLGAGGERRPRHFSDAAFPAGGEAVQGGGGCTFLVSGSWEVRGQEPPTCTCA